MRILSAIFAALSPGPPLVAGLVLFFVAGILGFRALDLGAVQQPIAFNHAKHLESGLSCTDCHSGAESQAHAVLPNLATCLACHEEAVTESPEEQKLRALAAAGKELQWNQITRVAPHVYFSHRRHVQLGKLECTVCHGPMQQATAPPRRAFLVPSMDACLGCHRQARVKTDCNDCHR
jgi:hypothetical protein